jgi:hypothetical protein
LVTCCLLECTLSTPAFACWGHAVLLLLLIGGAGVLCVFIGLATVCPAILIAGIVSLGHVVLVLASCALVSLNDLRLIINPLLVILIETPLWIRVRWLCSVEVLLIDFSHICTWLVIAQARLTFFIVVILSMVVHRNVVVLIVV